MPPDDFIREYGKNFISLISDQSDLSLYIHIPFCRKKCGYCAFYSRALGSLANGFIGMDNPVIARIIEETKTAAEAWNRPFASLYIGGGNPGMVDRLVLERLISCASRCGEPAEVTIESNPENYDREMGALLNSFANTRLSLGVQTLSPVHLETVGRSGLSRDTMLQLLKSFGTDSRRWQLSLDMITGIPGSTSADTCRDIDVSVNLAAPDHLSVYELSIEPGTPLAEKYERFRKEKNSNTNDCIPSREAEDDPERLTAVWDHLQGMGYVHYEISNFARKSALRGRNAGSISAASIHNMRYWEMRPYLGIGPGAASTLYQPSAKDNVPLPPGALRIECDADIESYGKWGRGCSAAGIQAQSEMGTVGRSDAEYLRSSFSCGYRMEELTVVEQAREWLMMGLRPSLGIDLERFRRHFRTPLQQLVPETLNREIRRGNLEMMTGRLKATTAGKLLLNPILVELFREMDSNCRLLQSRVPNFPKKSDLRS